MLKKLKKIFWNGIRAFVPIVVTLAIVFWIFRGIEALFGYFLKLILPQYYFDGLGVLVGFLFIFLIGFLFQSWFVRYLYALGDRLLKRIPFIKTIYNAVQELLNFFDVQNKAQQVVLVETPWGKVMGFITHSALHAHLPPLGNEQEVLVYIPFSYLVGGISLIVPKSRLTPVDWPMKEAISFIITAGMTGQKSK